MTRDVIRVRGVQALGRHGVLPEERLDTQPFLADLEVGIDLRPAGLTDDLVRTVSYAELAELARDHLQGPPVQLVETLASRIADAVMAYELVQDVSVTVHKPQAPLGVALGDVAVTVRRVRRREAVVALGANLGDRERTLATALGDLAAVDGVRVRAVSSLVDTDPVEPPQPAYLNAVALLDTRLHPATLLAQLHRIETVHRRQRDEPWGPRTLDLDLIQVGEPGPDGGRAVAGKYPLAWPPGHGPLLLPHPRAGERAFVLAPWYEVDPAAQLSGVPVERLLGALDTSGVRPGPPWPGGTPW